MRNVFIVLSLLVLTASSHANSVTTEPMDAGANVPKLQFDKQGRLILVVIPEGKACIYQYGKDGELISPIESSCGNPLSWLKAK